MATEHITIKIETGNAAFDEECGGSPTHEIARILRDLADRFEDGTPPEYLRDVNGNRVGTVDVRPADE